MHHISAPDPEAITKFSTTSGWSSVMMHKITEDPTMMTRHPGRSKSLVISIAVGVLSLPLIAFHTGIVATTRNDDAYEQEILKGKDLLRRRQYEDALKSFHRANEMRGKNSAECFDLIGLALQASAEKKDQKKLQAAEAAFRHALTIEGATPLVHYNLGVTLLQLHRDAEGIAEINQYIKAQPNGPFVTKARKIVENPRRARENYAPDFSFTSLQGEYISLDDLRGKVVVLDFWGTWCRPCVDSVPELRSMHKKYSKEPSFVLIGISSDTDDERWKEFTEKNKMVWPQYRDRDRRILRAFNVREFPTYVVIDHEGIVRFQSDRSIGERSMDLEDAIRKQVKIVAKSLD